MHRVKSEGNLTRRHLKAHSPQPTPKPPLSAQNGQKQGGMPPFQLVYDRINRIYRIFWLVRLWYETPTVGRLSTRKTPKRLRGRNRARAIDGGVSTSGSKPAASPAATSPPSPFGFPGSDASRKFALRANFRVAGEAENRRLMSARVTAAELLSSVALAQEDARVRWHSHRHQSPDRAIDA